MANDGKLYIVITDKLEGGEIETPASNDNSVNNEKNKKTGSSLLQHQFNNFVISQAKQFVNYNLNNIGTFTGDYVKQRRTNESMQALGIIMNIGNAFLTTTISTGNPYVGLGAAAIVTAGTLINAGYAEYTSRIENKYTNYSIEQLRKRAGLNVYLDGSRGTED